MKPQRLLGALLLTFGIFIGLNGCIKDELSDIWDDLKDHDNRITELEEKLNGDVTSLQNLLAALENSDYITGIADNKDGSYTITFKSNGDVTIRNGKDGENSFIEVKEDSNGKLCWTEEDGDWLRDQDGNKIPITAVVAPQIRINPDNKEWEISTDGGVKWESTGVKASGNEGPSIFSGKPELSNDGKSYTFSLTGGTSFSVPAYQETCLIFSVGGVTISKLSETIQLSAATPTLGYTIQSSASGLRVKVSLDDSSCKATVNPVSSTIGNISFTGMTAGKTVSLSIEVLQNGKELIEYLLYVTSTDEPTVPAAPLSIAQVDNLIKILPNADVTHKPEILRVARGETATLQLAVTALDNVGQVTPSVNFKGTSLPATMGWVRYIKSTPYYPSWTGGTPNDRLDSPDYMYPDPIMPHDAWNVSLNNGERAVLWTEFSVDRNCEPGTYEGEVVLSVSGDKSLAAPFTVQVYPATLPEKQTFTLVQWENGTYNEMNGGAAVEVGTDTYFNLQKNVVQLVSKYGQNGFRIQDGFVPSKVSAWYTDETDPATGQRIPTFNFWNDLDPYIQNYLDNCPNVSQIHGPGFAVLQNYEAGDTKTYGRLVASIGVDNGNSWVDGRGKALPEDADAQFFLKCYFQKLEAHLKSKKLPDGRTWFDIYRQSIFDEPTDARAADWNAWAKLVKAGSPTMKIVEATNTKQLNPDYCDILCPVLDHLSTTKATGNQTQWFYTAISPAGTYANRFIAQPLIKTRLLHWIHYKYNSVGTLHWGLKYWMGVEDPYGDAQGSGNPGGDNYIIYPGNGVAYPSIRLAAMRDGVNDYELLKLLEKKSSSEAKALADKLVYGYDSYNTGVENFRAVKKELLEKLQ